MRKAGLVRGLAAIAAPLAVLMLTTACDAEPATPTPVASATPTPKATPAIILAPTPTATPAPAPSPTRTAAPASAPTVRHPPTMAGQTLTFDTMPEVRPLDIYELARDLRPDLDLTPPTPPDDTPGDARDFTAYDLQEATRVGVATRLCASTDHFDFYLSDDLGLTCRIFGGDFLRRIEEDVRPSVIAGFAGDREAAEQLRVAVVHANLVGFGGYFDSSDLYPQAINPFASGAYTLYLNAAQGKTGNPRHAGYIGLFAHELQHAFHQLSDPDESTWVNEGLSVLTEGGRNADYFLDRCPPSQVIAWPSTPGAAACNYAGSGLIMRYLRDNYPDRNGTLGALVAEPANGLRGIDAYLTGIGADMNVLDVLADWGAANYLDGRSNLDPYANYDAHAPVGPTLRAGDETLLNFTQFYAEYFALPSGPGTYTLEFDGAVETPLLPNPSGTLGSFWHAGSEDAAAYSLTRTFDLRAASRADDATLTLLLRYSTEENWDYIYMTASRDGGETWTVLRSPSMEETSDIAFGRAFGPGLTGTSGDDGAPQWTLEEVDLADFVGEEIMFRVLYLTDQAISLDGVSVGGAWLPAADYAWVGIDHEVPAALATPSRDAPADGGWEPDGFFFSNMLVEQRYAVKVLFVEPDGTAVTHDMEIDGAGWGRMAFTLDGDEQHAAIMVMPLAPQTRQPAAARLGLQIQTATPNGSST